MEQTVKTLKIEFYSLVAIAILLVALFETDILPNGTMTGRNSAEFILTFTMEFTSVCLIPLALRLFKFGGIARALSVEETRSSKLLFFATIRMLILFVPLVCNVVLYYLFMKVAFGYLAIIHFICLFFIVPTKGRCESETNNNSTDK